MLLAKYQQHQVVIFDPYFEDAGLGLLLLCAASKADYVVFTSLPKLPKQIEATPENTDKPGASRINNLMASCEQNSSLLKRLKLRIYGLRDGRLHDRYILIMEPDGLPAAGFNLSNSFQKAAENYPLLVTPIPADVLLEVEQYKVGLIQEATDTQTEGKDENPTLRILFDSSALPSTPRRYEPLRLLDKARSGDVLSLWTGEPTLKGLSGERLKQQMTALGLLENETLTLSDRGGLRNYLDQQKDDFASFGAAWDVLGDLLAHSHTEDHGHLEPRHDFLGFLARFILASFNGVPHAVNEEITVMDTRLFTKTFEALLNSSYQTSHLFHATKFPSLTWSHYFAIKFLWDYSPEVLVSTVEERVANAPPEFEGPGVVWWSLLSQIVSEISLSIEFNTSELQRDCLIHSSNGLMKWMGLNAIEQALEKPDGLMTTLKLIAPFSYPEQVHALGWLIRRAATNPQKAEIYRNLIAALHGILPTPIAADDLRCIVDSMRGHMRELGWAEPWLSRDVVFPLLQDDRAHIDDASQIWANELAKLLGPENQPRLFEQAREGQTTNIAAFFFAYSSAECQKSSVALLKTILSRQQRILQQPLASTSVWARWNDALVISMWILTFTCWSRYYLSGRNLKVRELEQLSQNAHDLAMIRSREEWRSLGVAPRGGLAAFLDKAEEQLAARNGLAAEKEPSVH